jgi:ComF family protein
VDDASIVLMRLLGDLLSPPQCAACESDVPRRHVFCPSCATTVEGCPAESALAGGSALAEGDEGDVAFGYYGGALATAIRRLKYEDRPHLARPLGELLRGACRVAETRADAVLPVPLHPRRLVARGYNQSALLAGHVATELGAPLLTSVLARAVDTVPQVELSADGRHDNVGNAFVVRSSASLQGKTLAVVDDVSTTGATLQACRRALLARGAKRVIGLVLARTPPSALRIPLALDAGTGLDLGVNRACASSGCANVPMRANLRN